MVSEMRMRSLIALVAVLITATSAFAISEAELRTVAGRLSKAAGRSFNVTVVSEIDGDDYNASCDPDGRIEVTQKFLAEFRSADEAAGVIGHEMAHYQLRHHPKQQRANIFGALLGLGVAKAVGAKDRDDYELGAELGAGIVGGATSRRQENQADAEGIRLVFSAGYNPNAMVALYRRVVEKHGPGEARVPVLGWFASHPDMRSRIGRLEKESAKFSESQPTATKSASAPVGAISAATDNRPTAVVVVDPEGTDNYGLGFGRGYYYVHDLSEVAKQEAEAALERRGFDVLVSTQDVGPLMDELDLENSEYGQYGENRTPKGYFSGAENVFYVSAWVAGANEYQVGDWRRQLEVSGLKVGVLLRQVDLKTRKQLLAGAGTGLVNKISRVRIPLGRSDYWNPVEVELESEQNLARQAVAKAVTGAAGKFSAVSALPASTFSAPVSESGPRPLTEAEMAQTYAPEPPVLTFGFVGVTNGRVFLGSEPIVLEMTAPVGAVEVTFAVTDANGRRILGGESFRSPRFALRLKPEMMSGMKFPLTLTASTQVGAKTYRTEFRLERR